MKMPMPKNLKQARALMGGVGYYHEFLPDLFKRIRPLTALLQKGVKYVFAPAIEVFVCQILAELAASRSSLPSQFWSLQTGTL